MENKDFCASGLVSSHRFVDKFYSQQNMTMFVAPLSSFFSPGPELAGLCHAAALDLYGIRYDHVRLRQMVYESPKSHDILCTVMCVKAGNILCSAIVGYCASLWCSGMSGIHGVEWGGVCGKTVFWQCTHASDATPVVGQERSLEIFTISCIQQWR